MGDGYREGVVEYRQAIEEARRETRARTHTHTQARASERFLIIAPTIHAIHLATTTTILNASTRFSLSPASCCVHLLLSPLPNRPVGFSLKGPFCSLFFPHHRAQLTLKRVPDLRQRSKEHVCWKHAHHDVVNRIRLHRPNMVQKREQNVFRVSFCCFLFFVWFSLPIIISFPDRAGAVCKLREAHRVSSGCCTEEPIVAASWVGVVFIQKWRIIRITFLPVWYDSWSPMTGSCPSL